MKTTRTKRPDALLILSVLPLLALAPGASHAATARGARAGGGTSGAPVTIEVDATDAPMHILHARLVLPVKPGPFTIVYPQWIPGEHVGSSRVDLQACKLEYSIVSPK